MAAVAFTRVVSHTEEQDVGFLLGKAKVASKHSHSIPHLELCAPLLASEIAETLVEHLDIHIDSKDVYTDSKIVF